MSLHHRYNNENVLTRAVLAGLLDVLNNRVDYTQIWGDLNSDNEQVKVPWYFNQSGDERFMQDFYTHYAHCFPPKPADGNFDKIPRGTITYTGSGINAQRITSRYVQGKYVKEINGKLEQYTSFLYSMPLDVNIDAELWIDTYLTALKLEQQLREILYKNVTYYVYYKGMRVGCTAGFPEEVGIEKLFDYSFEDKNKIKIKFQISIESYQPVFDPTTEQLASSTMGNIGYRVYPVDQKDDGAIQILSPAEGITLPKGIPLWIDYNQNRERDIISNINVYWLNYGGNERFEIALQQQNHEYYIWNIPEDFTDFKEPVIIWEENDNISIIRDPYIKIVPDIDSSVIDSSSFYMVEEGYFQTNSEDTSINLQLEMTDDAGNKSYSPDGAIWANVLYNKLNGLNPVTVDPSTTILFPGTVDYKHINIQIANSANTDVFGILSDIKIV